MITALNYGGVDLVTSLDAWGMVCSYARPSGSQAVQTVQPQRSAWAVHYARKNAQTALAVEITAHKDTPAEAFAQLHDFMAQVITSVPQGDLVIVDADTTRTYQDAVLESYEPEPHGLTNRWRLSFRCAAADESDALTFDGDLLTWGAD